MNFETHFVQEYKAGLEMVCQQLSSATREATTPTTVQGERASFDEIGSVSMQPRGGRATDLPRVETPNTRRWLSHDAFAVSDYVDKLDTVRMLNNPTSSIVQAFGAAAARQIDKTVFTAALGTVYTGKDGTTPVVLPSAQKIAQGGTGFTYAKIRELVRRLRQRNALMKGDTIHVYMTSKQEEQLIDTAEMKSSDYNNKKVLVNGGLDGDDFYACHFHVVDDHFDESAGTVSYMLPWASANSGTRSCIAWVKSGIKLAVPVMDGEVVWDPKKYSTFVSAVLDLGAYRANDRKVIQIDCLETQPTFAGG